MKKVFDLYTDQILISLPSPSGWTEKNSFFKMKFYLSTIIPGLYFQAHCVMLNIIKKAGDVPTNKAFDDAQNNLDNPHTTT